MRPKNKGTVNEEGTFSLMQRYSPTTIISLLQEVYQFAGVKIDWKALVKNTSTGISNAREYQMVWRHLAYCDALLEKVQEGAEPLDDESDLEFELEAVPAVSIEASSEVTACVKTILSSTTLNDVGALYRVTDVPKANAPNTLKSNVPEEIQACSAPGSAHKQSQSSGVPFEGRDGNLVTGLGTTTSKKKRKLWTEEEDQELMAAVKKYGEGNWSAIVRGDFKHDRTVSQLSQRWAYLKKHQNNSAPSFGNKSNGTSQEAMLATRNAVSLALNMPTFGSFSTISSGTVQASIPAAPAVQASTPEPPTITQAHNPLQTASNQAAAVSTPKAPSASKPRTGPKKKAPPRPEKPSIVTSSIQAAALAAGGRMATPTAAATLLAQTKNVFHIRPGGTALPKSSMTHKRVKTGTNTSGSQPRTVRVARRPFVVPSAPSGPGSGTQKATECLERNNEANNAALVELDKNNPVAEAPPDAPKVMLSSSKADESDMSGVKVNLSKTDVEGNVGKGHSEAMEVDGDPR